MSFAQAVEAKALELAEHVLRMTTAAGSGHPSSALSILHLVITLTHRVMRHDPRDPWNPAADRLVLSEGHAVPAVYAAWADLGGVVGNDRDAARVLTFDDLAELRALASPLDGHPNPFEGFPFFDAATGSLGQGLSVAAGLALATRLAGTDRRFYVIIGDGESREGQVWEAVDFIVDHGLTSVVALFNCNGQGQADYVSPRQGHDVLAAKLAAFGWDPRVIDGHNADQIEAAVTARGPRPVAVVARTQKGWSVEPLKDKSNHGKPLTAAQLDVVLPSLREARQRIRTEVRLGPPARPAAPSAARTPAAGPPARPADEKTAPVPLPFARAMKDAGLEQAVAKNACATRRAFGAALLALGRSDERIVAFDGDVSNSTFSEIFARALPKRFFECKIAEQNMVSAAVGAAAAGLIPFVCSFAKFIARAYDQIEMAQIGRANVKLVGSHAGISLAADGPSQMSIHDVAYFRAASSADDGRGAPVCVLFHPADAVAAFHCTGLMAAHRGMCYLRTHRPDVPLIYKPDTPFRIGGSHVLAGDTGRERLVIVSTGYMVHQCLRAVADLAAAGVPCTLIDAYSFPLDAAPILDAARRSGGAILVVEDNYLGGLAGAVSEAAAAEGGIRVRAMTCRRIPKSARTPEETLAFVGLSAGDILSGAKSLLA